MKINLTDKEVRDVGESRYRSKTLNKQMLISGIVALACIFIMYALQIKDSLGLILIGVVAGLWFIFMFYLSYIMTKEGKKFLEECKEKEESENSL